MKKILFQGDSITDACRTRDDDDYMGVGYANLVKGALGFEYPNRYQFQNRGISGNRVVDLYARIKADIIKLKPDVLSILIGVNDVWFNMGEDEDTDDMETEKYLRIYSMLIEEIIAALPNVQIMIMEPFTLKGSGNEAYWERFNKEVRKRAQKAREIAERYQLTFVPLQEKFDEAASIAPNEYWLMDGVHPHTAGHELIKREWIKAFKKLSI